MMSLSLLTLLLFALVAISLFKVTASLLGRTRRPRRRALREDPNGLRSHVTFKPLPRFYDVAKPPQAPFTSAMASEFFDRLRQRGAQARRIGQVGHAARVQLDFDNERWIVTLGPFKTHPEQWLLKLDMVVGRNTPSAPHDVAASRAVVTLIKNVLEGMQVSTIRWHHRQSWDAGKVDIWSHKPF